VINSNIQVSGDSKQVSGVK